MTGRLPQMLAVAAATLCIGLCMVQPSYAGASASVAATQQLASGEWAAAPSASALTFGAQTRNAFFTVKNTGTLSLVGVSYTVSGNSLPRNATVSVLGCVAGTWNVSTGSCSGTQVTVVTTTGVGATAAVSTSGLFPAAVGSSVQLEVTIDKNPQTATSAAISVTVSRADVRAAVTLNA